MGVFAALLYVGDGIGCANGATDLGAPSHGQSTGGSNSDGSSGTGGGTSVGGTSSGSGGGSGTLPGSGGSSPGATGGASGSADAATGGSSGANSDGSAGASATGGAGTAGSCNNLCPVPANATATCVDGGCGFTCNAGSAELDGHCATFGGVYATGDAAKGCPATNCNTANPFTGGCSCPGGFSALGPLELLDTSSCPNKNPPYGWQSLFVCISSSFNSAADFGGAYERLANNSCTVPNPWTGACSCPAPSMAIEFIVDGSCWENDRIGLCLNASATTSTFGGGFELADATYGCVTGNPATGGCSCQNSLPAISVRNVYGPPVGCKSDGAWGAHLNICYVP